MILFVNFAPIQFMGGAEKWMYEVAKYLNKSEDVSMVYVSEDISSIYSRMVLSRDFKARVNIDEANLNLNALQFKDFLPFGDEFKKIRRKFKESRKIYIKYEINEIFIVLYFGGFKILKKIICGIHSPFNYETPLNFFEKLHNWIYLSRISNFILSKVKCVHVITTRDEDFFKKKFHLKNVVYIPTSVDLQNRTNLNSNTENKEGVNILFVGELSMRKGIDILCEIIEKCSDKVKFDIAGDGPMKENIISVAKLNTNAKYHNFLDKEELLNLYQKADLLLLPSRAEGFPLVFHEAMSNGLMIVDSSQVSVGLPDYVEISVSPNESSEYVKVFEDFEAHKIDKPRIINYYDENFRSEKILPIVDKYLFV